MNIDRNLKLKVLAIITLLIITAAFLLQPIAQDKNYHQFADVTTILGIPNAWNVMSNIPFVVVGFIGLISLYKHHKTISRDSETIASQIFFIGMILTGFGSAYYHLAPTNETLIWDRLLMTISFMAFFSFVLSLHIDKKLGARVLWPLLTLGVVSVIYWAYTESMGVGDLRFYAVIQFFPMILIPVVLILFPVTRYKQTYLWWVISLYAIAKVLELYDDQIYQLLSISGHSLKHMVAALTGVTVLQAIRSKAHR